MMPVFQMTLFFLLLAAIGNVEGLLCPEKCFSDPLNCFLDDACVLENCCIRYPLHNRLTPTDPCDACALEKGCEKEAQFCVSHNCCK
ncbi:hypothetical protein DdX_15456 [Ditylenchus destructor]|uniref:Uncharacterized protein n=1 Tax=Ditylenchus destructor TaxID=166010 RepID=A0AAD4R0R8_9BILA|nr:hypothetical protein DdX_15456 [Ditylenchus destructor]